MKKLLIAALAIVALASVAAMAGHYTETLPPASAYGSTPVSNGYDYQNSTDSGAPSITAAAPVSLYSRTIAQLNSLTPVTTGQIVYCNNCTIATICVSSGVLTGAWVVVSSTGGVVASQSHCQ